MGIASSNDPFAGQTTLIDKLIGNAYEVVKRVAANIDAIKHVSANLESIYAVDLIKSNIATLIANLEIIGRLVDNPAPLIPFVISPVECAPHVDFDLSLAAVQELKLTGNVDTSTILDTPLTPTMIVLRIIQDEVGGRSFAWPAAIHSHGDIDLTPNAISQQMFAKNIDGSYDFISPMMYPKGV